MSKTTHKSFSFAVIGIFNCPMFMSIKNQLSTVKRSVRDACSTFTFNYDYALEGAVFENLWKAARVRFA
jgi:hypothetical protein